jgi:hypothetical protein
MVINIGEIMKEKVFLIKVIMNMIHLEVTQIVSTVFSNILSDVSPQQAF